jgi:23S rRNA (cytosine1962-C5)-methyltransferase
VGVYASDGSFLATGHYQIGSIAVRVLSFDAPALSPDFWKVMISRALEVRKACGLASSATTSCYRLVHGEGDNLPGLIIDYYDGVCVMQAHSVGMFRAKKQICEALVEVYGDSLRAVYDKSSGTAPFKAGLDLVDGYLYKKEGFNDDEQVVLENGHKFMVNWTEGQKTGFFLDQKENRREVMRLCEGARVLDCFTHNGSFALHAAKAGAASVLGVDISEEAVEVARENARINGLDNARFEAHNCFDHLRELTDAKEKFDVVILDPPAFTKTRAQVESALRGYKEINLRGLKLVKNGGFLVSCSCSQHVSEDKFVEVINTAARDSKKRLRFVELRSQGHDHPVLPASTETRYLKCAIIQVYD